MSFERWDERLHRWDEANSKCIYYQKCMYKRIFEKMKRKISSQVNNKTWHKIIGNTNKAIGRTGGTIWLTSYPQAKPQRNSTTHATQPTNMRTQQQFLKYQTDSLSFITISLPFLMPANFQLCSPFLSWPMKYSPGHTQQAERKEQTAAHVPTNKTPCQGTPKTQGIITEIFVQANMSSGVCALLLHGNCRQETERSSKQISEKRFERFQKEQLVFRASRRWQCCNEQVRYCRAEGAKEQKDRPHNYRSQPCDKNWTWPSQDCVQRITLLHHTKLYKKIH